MRNIVHVSDWSPPDNDLSKAVVSPDLKERLAKLHPMVGTKLWHNGFILEVTGDRVANNTRTLTCRTVGDEGPTTQGWTLYSKATS